MEKLNYIFYLNIYKIDYICNKNINIKIENLKLLEKMWKNFL